MREQWSPVPGDHCSWAAEWASDVAIGVYTAAPFKYPDSASCGLPSKYRQADNCGRLSHVDFNQTRRLM